MDRYQYLLLMAACAFGTLPLEFVFRARVYRRPRRLAGALAVPLAVFLVWDAVAIARHHWRFNDRYVTGWELPFSVPIEELAFFVVIPICALLTFEACGYVLARTKDRDDDHLDEHLGDTGDQVAPGAATQGRGTAERGR